MQGKHTMATYYILATVHLYVAKKDGGPVSHHVLARERGMKFTADVSYYEYTTSAGGFGMSCYGGDVSKAKQYKRASLPPQDHGFIKVVDGKPDQAQIEKLKAEIMAIKLARLDRHVAKRAERKAAEAAAKG
jgi:hypothetical protein